MSLDLQPRPSRRSERARSTLKYRFGLLGAYVVGAGVLCAQLALTLPGAVQADAAHLPADAVVAASVSSRGATSLERDTPVPQAIAEATAEATPEPLAQIVAVSDGIAASEAEAASTDFATPYPPDFEFMAAAERVRVAGATAVASPAPSEPPARRAETLTYTVGDGDTVAALAERYGISESTILQANGLQPGASLLVGQQLLILPVSGFIHTVVDGETILSLADRYGVIPEDFTALNDLADPDVIVPGQSLIVPEVPDFERAPLPTPATVPTARASVAAETATPTAIPPTAAPTKAPTQTPTKVPTQAPTQTPVPTATRPAEAPGGAYVVVAGDTAYSIARRFGVPLPSLLSANGLDPEKPALKQGQKLQIPGATAGAATTSAPTATAMATAAPALTATPTAAPATSTPRPQPTATPTARPPAPAVPSGKGGEIVSTSMKFVGYRYVWGGTSPQPGFDCSGFVWYVLNQVGVGIPRDLWSQYGYGAKVDRNALQPGDIVFFQNTYRAGLSHDGIYIGNGEFVHAATESAGVIVSRLDHPYWSGRYVGAIRP